MYTQSDFNQIVRIFKQSVRGLQALVLFGSYARGAAGEDSDADIAAIVDRQIERSERLVLLTTLWNTLAASGYATDIVLKESRLYELDKNIPGTLSYTIEHEGRVLWKNAA